MSDSSSKQTSHESILYQCEGHAEVCSNSEINSYIAWLRAQVNLEGDLFSEMYLSLLHRFSDWTQSLKQSGLHWEDPIFNYGIARAKALLEMNEVMLKKRTEDEEILRFFCFLLGYYRILDLSHLIEKSLYAMNRVSSKVFGSQWYLHWWHLQSFIK